MVNWLPMSRHPEVSTVWAPFLQMHPPRQAYFLLALLSPALSPPMLAEHGYLLPLGLCHSAPPGTGEHLSRLHGLLPGEVTGLPVEQNLGRSPFPQRGSLPWVIVAEAWQSESPGV